eukprot:TRINITY_DN29747_c0_g1_i1.p1 TRINITY_DN29747_c0_g1~~TRINITY_DN29747_c0_g1_i1.p1  ORF type:complete len:565 (+),score=91.44 TRINITY_DN29747_c0_g1_i1:184-1878(+)
MNDGAFDTLLDELRTVHRKERQRWQDRLSEVQAELEAIQQIPLESSVMEASNHAWADSGHSHDHKVPNEPGQLEAAQHVAAEGRCKDSQQLPCESGNPVATLHTAADSGNDHPSRMRDGVCSEPTHNVIAKGTSSTAQLDSAMPVARMRSGLAVRLAADTTEQLYRESTGTSFGDVIHNEKFDVIYSLLIIASSFVMACEAQYKGIGLAADFGYHGASDSAGKDWPGAFTAFEVLDWTFGILFTLEIVLKLAALPRRFCKDSWNWFDVLVILLWAWSKIVMEMGNVTVLRIVRLVRLTRLIRLVRRFEAFDTLFLMTTVIKGSVPLMLWACVILIFCQLLFALVLFQFLDEFYFVGLRGDRASLTAEHYKMYEYYGSFSRCMVTMFEITLANWPPACRLLIEHVSEWFALFAIFHKLFIGFAVVGVINGVFMQETFKIAGHDDAIMMRQKQKDSRIHMEKMRALFSDADTSGDGRLDSNEFAAVMSLPDVQVWLSAMGLEVSDTNNLFQLLVTDEGVISAEQLVKGVSKLKGAARSIDVHNLMRQHEDMKQILVDIRNFDLRRL